MERIDPLLERSVTKKSTYIKLFKETYGAYPYVLPDAGREDIPIPYPDTTRCDMELSEEGYERIISDIRTRAKYDAYIDVIDIRSFPLYLLFNLKWNLPPSISPKIRSNIVRRRRSEEEQEDTWLVTNKNLSSIIDVEGNTIYSRLEWYIFQFGIWKAIPVQEISPKEFLSKQLFPFCVLIAGGTVYLCQGSSRRLTILEPISLRYPESSKLDQINIDEDMGVALEGIEPGEPSNIPYRFITQYGYRNLREMVLSDIRYHLYILLSYPYEIPSWIMILFRKKRQGIDPMLDILDYVHAALDPKRHELFKYILQNTINPGSKSSQEIGENTAKNVLMRNMLALIPSDFCKGSDMRNGTLPLNKVLPNYPVIYPSEVHKKLITSVSKIKGAIISGGTLLSMLKPEYEASDLDIFIYGSQADTITIWDTLNMVLEEIGKIIDVPDVVEMKGSVIQFDSNIKVQIILTSYLTPSQVIYSFDLGHTMGYIDYSGINISPYMLTYLLSDTLPVLWPVVSASRIEKAQMGGEVHILNPFTGKVLYSDNIKEIVYDTYNIGDALKLISPSTFTWTSLSYGSVEADAEISIRDMYIPTIIESNGIQSDLLKYIPIDEYNQLAQLKGGYRYQLKGLILYNPIIPLVKPEEPYLTSTPPSPLNDENYQEEEIAYSPNTRPESPEEILEIEEEEPFTEFEL